MYLIPPVNEAGKTICLPMEEGSVSPLLQRYQIQPFYLVF